MTINRRKFVYGSVDGVIEEPPGNGFPVLRVAAQRDGDADTGFARILKLGRVRIVVS